MQTAKLVHLPANMMMAGLAPRIGKSGASIRLFWARIEECLCHGPCVTEPITLLKRYLTGGRWLANLSYGNNAGAGAPLITIPIPTGNAVVDAATFARSTNPPPIGGGANSPYYILIFDKIVTSPFAPNSNQATVPLQIFKGNISGANGIITIPATDYKYMTWSGAGTSLGLPTEQFNTLQVPPQAPSSGWTIDIDGDFGDDTVGTSKWHPVNTNNANSIVGGVPVAFPSIGGWVGPGGPNVPPGQYSKWGPNITYLIDKNVSTHFPSVPDGRGAIVFHIGDLLVNSWQNNALSGTSIQFGSDPVKELMLLVDATTSVPPGTTKNNISTTYRTPSGLIKGATINTQDNCFGEIITAPIASFDIKTGPSGAPFLEQLPV